MNPAPLSKADGEAIRASLFRIEDEFKCLAEVAERVGDKRLLRAVGLVMSNHIGCLDYEALPILMRIWPDLFTKDTFLLGDGFEQ